MRDPQHLGRREVRFGPSNVREREIDAGGEGEREGRKGIGEEDKIISRIAYIPFYSSFC